MRAARTGGREADFLTCGCAVGKEVEPEAGLRDVGRGEQRSEAILEKRVEIDGLWTRHEGESVQQLSAHGREHGQNPRESGLGGNSQCASSTARKQERMRH